MPSFLSRINSFGELWEISSSFHSPLIPPPSSAFVQPLQSTGHCGSHQHRLPSSEPLGFIIPDELWGFQAEATSAHLLLFAFGGLFSLSLVLPWTWVVSCAFNADFQTPWHYLCGICLDLGECLSRWDKKGKLTRCCEETDLPLKVFLSSNSLHWRVC